MSDTGSRYERSMPGLAGAMVVVIGVILVFVLVRSCAREDVEVEREPIDYLPNVEAIQAEGSFPVVYPERLPDGWKAVDVTYTPPQVWGLSMFTGEDHYVGLFQGKSSVEDMVEEYVDEEAEEGDPVELDDDLAGTWRSFHDEGGDHAVVARHAGTVVLLVSSGEEADLERLARRLSARPVVSP